MYKAAHFLLARGIRHWFRDTAFEPIADVYVRNLVDRGYSLEATKAYIRCVAHFAHCSAGKHLRLADFDESHAGCFLEKHLPTCRSDRGDERAAVMYSLIQTPRMNDVDPQGWLAEVLARINDHKIHSLNQLLRWNWRRTSAELTA